MLEKDEILKLLAEHQKLESEAEDELKKMSDESSDNYERIDELKLEEMFQSGATYALNKVLKNY